MQTCSVRREAELLGLATLPVTPHDGLARVAELSLGIGVYVASTCLLEFVR